MLEDPMRTQGMATTFSSVDKHFILQRTGTTTKYIRPKTCVYPRAGF